MAIERAFGSASYVDLIDHVLDKGIVIDAWMLVSVGGIDLITIEAHMIVASFDTYLEHWPALAEASSLKKLSPILDNPSKTCSK